MSFTHVLRACGGRDERGATSVEYGLMAALITLVIGGVVAIFGGSVEGLFSIPPSVWITGI